MLREVRKEMGMGHGEASREWMAVAMIMVHEQDLWYGYTFSGQTGEMKQTTVERRYRPCGLYGTLRSFLGLSYNYVD